MYVYIYIYIYIHVYICECNDTGISIGSDASLMLPQAALNHLDFSECNEAQIIVLAAVFPYLASSVAIEVK